MQKMEEGSNSVLMQEALFLFGQGVKTVLSDATSRRVISPYSEYSPIANREELVEMCRKYPAANLDIVADKKNGVVALGVGVGPGKDNWASSFLTLTGKHGSPDTLAYQLPDGTKYYLFKSDIEEPELDDTSGVYFLKDSHRVYCYPSTIDGQPVERIGDAMTIRNLSDWLGGTREATLQDQGGRDETSVEAVEATEQEDEDVGFVADVAEAIEAPTKDAEAIGSEVAVDAEPVTQPLLAAIDEAKEQEPREHPATTFKQVVAGWVASGFDKATVLSKALDWNRGNGEPFSMIEVVAVVEELTESTAEEAPPLTPRELLLKLAEDMVLFHDDQNKPYFFYEGEAFSAPSIHVKNRLTHHFLRETKDLPPNKDLNAVLNILESKARFDGPRISLFNRVANSDGAIIYDLRDKRYVKVSSAGWETIPSIPLFRRYQHLQPQAEPVEGGDPWRVFDYLAVPEESRLLIMVYIISLFVPKIAHPVLAVYGDQGSSKSFFCTVINRLVDPTLTERVIQPKNERDLIQTLRQKYVTVLDNLSKIDTRVSDIFCQVCTGGSISYRQLYTDDGENIAQFRHVVILNSINLAIVNADLMDRSIILKLRRIDPLDRKPEHELWAAFDDARPGILGGIFDTVARAMALYPTVEVEHLPRLADFAKWGYAIAEALGKSGKQFLEDFNQNVKRQNESVVEKNVLCQAVLTLMAEGRTYLAKVSDAHATLKSIAKQDSKDETFPKLPHHLRGGLDRLRSSLLEHGIAYEFIDRRASGVQVLFTKVASPATSSLRGITPDLASRNEADEPDEPQGHLPEVELDEIPEVVNG